MQEAIPYFNGHDKYWFYQNSKILHHISYIGIIMLRKILQNYIKLTGLFRNRYHSYEHWFLYSILSY